MSTGILRMFYASTDWKKCRGAFFNANKNPLLEFCLCNLGVAYDRNNNITPVKTAPRGFIDGAMSLLDAYVVYERNKELIDRDSLVF